jgi:transcriptional regulator with GAF, ATPase, and Fis domain
MERAVSEKRFREDLYYILSAYTIHVPPLRERKEEVRLLLRHFMHRLARQYGLVSTRLFASDAGGLSGVLLAGQPA